MKISWLLPCLLACGGTASRGGPPPEPAARQAELSEQLQRAAARAEEGDFVAVLSGLFSPGGVYLSNSPELLRGPAGARAWLERDTLATRSRARWTVVRQGVSADGRDGYAYGYFDVIHPAGDTLPGSFRSYWRRDPSGRWELLAFARGRRNAADIGVRFPPALAETGASRHPLAGGDTVRFLREIEATEAEFCDSAGRSVAAAFGRFAAPDAGKNEGAGYVFGPAAIAALFASPPPGQLGPAWRPQFGSAAVSGDLGFTLGPAWPRVAGPVQGPPPPNTGRYFTIWARQKDGSWRYLVD